MLYNGSHPRTWILTSHFTLKEKSALKAKITHRMGQAMRPNQKILDSASETVLLSSGVDYRNK